MELKPGIRIKSSSCSTEVMVIRGTGDYDLRCGGHVMGGNPVEMNKDFSANTLMGKRYVNKDNSLELLCTKPGEGSLSLAETLLIIKATQALPSSD